MAEQERWIARREGTEPAEPTCPGPHCVLHTLAMLQDWLTTGQWPAGLGGGPVGPANPPGSDRGLFFAAPYREESPIIASAEELGGALEHLEYSVFRRFHNALTRAERSRLDNTIENALYKIDRFFAKHPDQQKPEWQCRLEAARGQLVASRERSERVRDQARRADLKLAQLGSLTAEGFEEFVAELFEALGYEVERVGGSGDEGVDLRVRRAGLLGVVQCKYFSRGVIGSPELQKFLGTIHHTRSHKGFFVTTRTYTLAAEKFAADHPIELIDGPRLVELVQEALGPAAKRPAHPTLFD